MGCVMAAAITPAIEPHTAPCHGFTASCCHAAHATFKRSYIWRRVEKFKNGERIIFVLQGQIVGPT
jgi:hypothetical protein